ncbi:MAG: hypothetical protein IK954_08220 [Clostridia bacterium]|nr:hypothetical protein [Clostridia bacterium]
MKFYEKPLLSVDRLTAPTILTVSETGEWDPDWDTALEDEEQQSDDA